MENTTCIEKKVKTKKWQQYITNCRGGGAGGGGGGGNE